MGGQRVSKSQPSLCAGPSIPHNRFPFSLVWDFRPLIPAHGDRRLHGRLGGWSGFLSPEKRHQPRGFPKPVPLPVCAADDVGAGYGLALTCEASSSAAIYVAEAAG